MDKKSIQFIVRTLLTSMPHPRRVWYHICFWDGRIRCFPSDHTSDAHVVFQSILPWTIPKFISDTQVRSLTNKIFKFLKGKR